MEYPEKDEMVVVKVTQILGYGVFAELLEYGNAKGFIHISNVSSSWVKNIRNIVKMNQVRVAKVLSVDERKRQIDLSFASVSPQREKQKLTDFKQINREEKLIELLAKQENQKFDTVWDEVAEPLIEEYGSLHKAFQKVALKEDISNFIEEKWMKPVENLVEKNFVLSKKTLKGIIKMKSTANDGLEKIKEVLKEIKSKDSDVVYNGAGTYFFSASSMTFKDAEKKMKSLIEKGEKKAKKLNIEFEFNQVDKKNK